MNTAPPPLETSTRALLDLVEADRQRQCEQILGQARTRAAAVHTQARAEARARVRSVFEEQRQQLQAHVAAAQARLATLQRLRAQQRSSAMLSLAWQALPVALQARWAQADTRGVWVAHVLNTAHARLRTAAWRVLHPQDWPAAEQATAAQTLAGWGHDAARFEPDTGISAGLKVIAGGNVIDGSLQGLLADRAEVDALLLRALEKTA